MGKTVAQCVSFGAFGAVAARAAFDWRWRRGGRVSLWLAASLGLVTTMVAFTFAATLTWGDTLPVAARLVLGLLFIAFPLALTMFHASFGHVRTRLVHAVAIATLALAIWTIAIPSLPSEGQPRTYVVNAYVVALSLLWTSVMCWVIVGSWRRSAGRAGFTRARERTLAVAFLLLNGGLIGFAIGNEVAAAVLSSLSGLAAYAAYAPPARLRAMWRRRDSLQLRHALGELMETTTREDVGRSVLPQLVRLLGATSIALIDDDLNPVICHDMPTETIELARSLVAEHPGRPGEFTSRGPMVWGKRAGLWVVVVTDGGFAPAFGADEASLTESNLWIVRIAFDRIHQTDALRQREQSLLAAQQLAGFGSFSWDAATGVVEWSATLYDIFGVDHTAPVDYDAYLALIHPDDRDRAAATIQDAFVTGTEYDINYRLVRPDGEVRELDSHGMPIRDERGRVTGLRGVCQDVTNRMRLEQQLRSAYEAEREATTRLKAIDAMKNTILSAVSHELRTPLTSVLGMALTLRDRRSTLDESQQAELLEHLAAESERLERMLADLLDLDRLRRGVIEPRREQVDVAALVRDTVAPLDVDVETALEAVTLSLDPGKVQRIVENLVINASRHTPPDTPIWLHLRRIDEQTIEIRVEDAGPGIPEDQRAMIFEPFNRGDRTLGHAPGTGIGLALVEQFTQLHGGRVWVEDRPGGGASFVVVLPDRTDTAAPGAAGAGR